jgi:hypothetical protein
MLSSPLVFSGNFRCYLSAFLTGADFGSIAEYRGTPTTKGTQMRAFLSLFKRHAMMGAILGCVAAQFFVSPVAALGLAGVTLLAASFMPWPEDSPHEAKEDLVFTVFWMLVVSGTGLGVQFGNSTLWGFAGLGGGFVLELGICWLALAEHKPKYQPRKFDFP